jgi:hypothetical protein
LVLLLKKWRGIDFWVMLGRVGPGNQGANIGIYIGKGKLVVNCLSCKGKKERHAEQRWNILRAMTNPFSWITTATEMLRLLST